MIESGKIFKKKEEQRCTFTQELYFPPRFRPLLKQRLITLNFEQDATTVSVLLNNNNTFNHPGYYNADDETDDEAGGGYVDFRVAEAVSFNSFSMLDIDDNGGGITVQGQEADGGIFDINKGLKISLPLLQWVVC